MSTFYVLPSRPVLGRRFADYLQALFPGLDWTSNAWGELADALTAAANRPDVYVVHREELPAGDELHQALAEAYGAEAGDQVVEVEFADRFGGTTARRWRLGEESST